MLLDNFRKAISFVPYINTGTIIDYMTGKFLQGMNNTWVLDGGLSQCFGISGRGQTYKSGLAGSLLSGALMTHPLAEAIVYETEGNVNGPTRYDDFCPVGTRVSDRIAFLSSTDLSLSDFYERFVQLVDQKIKQRKDYMVEGPFLNTETGKPYKIWIPTFILIDSFSRSKATRSEEQITKTAIDASEMNQMWMLDGNLKTRIMSDLPTRAAKAGIYVLMTAHVGSKIEMQAYTSSPKQLQYMSSSDRMKNVGSAFEFLTTTLVQTVSASVLEEKDEEGGKRSKKCLYPNDNSTPVEVNEVATTLVRCKNNASGVHMPLVVSQYQGILNAVTSYHFLRGMKNYGLEEKRPEGGRGKMEYRPLILKESMNNRTVRKISEADYKVIRGLELVAQLCFVQKCWSTWNMPEWVKTPPKKFAEWLETSNSMSADRVLTSTGVWSTSKQERERLTLMDILEFLHNEKALKGK